MMKIFENPQEYIPLAKKAIKKFGYAPEHNLEWFFCATEPYQQPIFISWPDGSGLLTQKEKNAWSIFVNPVVPKEKLLDRVLEFIEYAFNQAGINKIWLELTEDESTKLKDIIKDRKLNYSPKRPAIDTWPVMNIEMFNPDLPGRHFKEIRNARNKFYREYKVEIKNAVECEVVDLKKMVDEWRKTRIAGDRAYYHRYYFLIESGFKCCKTARAMIINGKIVGLNGGWDIPNANKYFYAAIGLHNYSLKDLGLILYLEDLIWIKNAGYIKANMGGGFADLTNFKNQFLPESWYKTYLFSVIKSSG